MYDFISASIPPVYYGYSIYVNLAFHYNFQNANRLHTALAFFFYPDEYKLGVNSRMSSYILD